MILSSLSQSIVCPGDSWPAGQSLLFSAARTSPCSREITCEGEVGGAEGEVQGQLPPGQDRGGEIAESAGRHAYTCTSQFCVFVCPEGLMQIILV